MSPTLPATPLHTPNVPLPLASETTVSERFEHECTAPRQFVRRLSINCASHPQPPLFVLSRIPRSLCYPMLVPLALCVGYQRSTGALSATVPTRPQCIQTPPPPSPASRNMIPPPTATLILMMWTTSIHLPATSPAIPVPQIFVLRCPIPHPCPQQPWLLDLRSPLLSQISPLPTQSCRLLPLPPVGSFNEKYIRFDEDLTPPARLATEHSDPKRALELALGDLPSKYVANYSQ